MTLNNPMIEWLDGLIQQTEGGVFLGPDSEAVFTLSTTTLMLLQNHIADLEERLAEYENDETRRRRHLNYLERHIKELEAS